MEHELSIKKKDKLTTDHHTEVPQNVLDKLQDLINESHEQDDPI